MNLIKQPGRYAATIQEAQLGETEKGTPFLRLHFEAQEGEITGYLYLSEAACERTLKTLKDICPNLDFDQLGMLIGVPVSITCELDTYEGKTSLKVKWVNPPSKEIAPPPAGLTKTLNARFRALAGPTKPAAPASTPQRPAAPPARPAPQPARPQPGNAVLPGAPATAVDDDVPF